MNDEYWQKKKETADKLQSFAHHLARELSKSGEHYVREDLNSESSDWLAEIVGPRFSITISRRGYGVNAGRLTLSGSWPKNRRGEVYSPRNYSNVSSTSITIDENRDVASAAKDVLRRLIGPHEAAFAEMKKLAEASDASEDKKKAAAVAVAEALGADLPEPGRDGYYHFGTAGTACLDITVRGADSFEVRSDYRLTLPGLLQLIKAVK